MKSVLMRRKDMHNTGLVATGLSLASLGIICFVLTENQLTTASGSNGPALSDNYHVPQLVKVGVTGMVVVGFGLAIISAVGITKEMQPTGS